MSLRNLTRPAAPPGRFARYRRLPLPDVGTRLAWAARTSDGGGLVLALIVGAGSGLGAVVFRWLIKAFTQVLSGHADYAGLGHVANPHVPWLGRWFVLIAPVAAGLVYGPMVHFFAREARGHGVPEVMYAVARRGGRIAPQVAAVKALASALCIGGGGSVGREGPIVQIGSALGSTLGSAVRVPEARMRVLVACGAAGGIAATFNAPLAGVFFAMELILRDFAAGSFSMVVISSVVASVIGRAALGNHPFLHLPPFSVDNGYQYLLFATVGLVAGLIGVVFTRVLYLIEDACDWAWRGPEWLRPAAGGVLLGGLLLLLPQMYGVGYPVLGDGMAGKYAIAFLVVLMLAKMLATSLTIGIGGSGGVFAPSLFIGAMLGSAFGQALHHLAPGVAGPAGAYGLIGMGAVFAGAARAPITAVIIMFELTGEYTIILPLMAAIVLATGISRLATRDTIYTLKLRRRGIDLDSRPTANRLTTTTAGAVLQPVGVSVSESTTLIDAVPLLARSTIGQLPVVTDAGAYLGVVTARGLAEALADGDHDSAQVASLVEELPSITTNTTLDEALAVLDAAAASALPVLNSGGLVGWLTLRRVLGVLRAPPRQHQAGPVPASSSTGLDTAPTATATDTELGVL
jgi:CIC family chloride channel protein